MGLKKLSRWCGGIPGIDGQAGPSAACRAWSQGSPLEPEIRRVREAKLRPEFPIIPHREFPIIPHPGTHYKLLGDVGNLPEFPVIPRGNFPKLPVGFPETQFRETR